MCGGWRSRAVDPCAWRGSLFAWRAGSGSRAREAAVLCQGRVRLHHVGVVEGRLLQRLGVPLQVWCREGVAGEDVQGGVVGAQRVGDAVDDGGPHDRDVALAVLLAVRLLEAVGGAPPEGVVLSSAVE